MGQFTAPTDLPLVSVVIPAHNAERFVAQTLRSVLAQTYRNIEVLVINDGSTDRTEAIVRRFAQQDARVRLLTQSNAGVAAARNLGIQRARGQLIAPIDADDLWHLDNLAKQVEHLLKLPDSVGVVYSWSLDIDQQNQQTGGFHAARITGDVHATLLCHNFLGNASCTLIRRSCLVAVGGYSEQFQAQQIQGCEDWDLYLRLAERYEFGVVPEFLVSYRKLQHSMSYDYRRMANSHCLVLQTVQQRRPKLPMLLYCLSRSSLYIYFAHQCSDNGDDRNTLYWLAQAVQSDVTPWLRLGTYRLGLKSWLNLVRQSIFHSAKASYSPVPQPEKAYSLAASTPISVGKRQDAERSFAAQRTVSQAGRKGLSKEEKLSPLHNLQTVAAGKKNQPPVFPSSTRKNQGEKTGPSQLKVAFKVLVGSILHDSLSLLGKR